MNQILTNIVIAIYKRIWNKLTIIWVWQKIFRDFILLDCKTCTSKLTNQIFYCLFSASFQNLRTNEWGNFKFFFEQCKKCTMHKALWLQLHKVGYYMTLSQSIVVSRKKMCSATEYLPEWSHAFVREDNFLRINVSFQFRYQLKTLISSTQFQTLILHLFFDFHCIHIRNEPGNWIKS